MALNTTMLESTSFPVSYNSHCESSTVKRIGQDMRGIVDYNFNRQGFRADLDYDHNEDNSVAYFGNLYASAVGIRWQDGYAMKTCAKLQMKCYNFSQGCAGVDNNEIMRTVKHIKEMQDFKPRYYVIQFCELERRFSVKTQGLRLHTDQQDNIDNFVQVFSDLEKILEGEKWCFFGIDHAMTHSIPKHILDHKNCFCWNPVIIDKILQGIAGEKWHAMIAYGLNMRIKNDLALA